MRIFSEGKWFREQNATSESNPWTDPQMSNLYRAERCGILRGLFQKNDLSSDTATFCLQYTGCWTTVSRDNTHSVCFGEVPRQNYEKKSKGDVFIMSYDKTVWPKRQVRIELGFQLFLDPWKPPKLFLPSRGETDWDAFRWSELGGDVSWKFSKTQVWRNTTGNLFLHTEPDWTFVLDVRSVKNTSS